MFPMNETDKLVVTMVAVECPDELFQRFDSFESLQACLARSDTMIEDDSWPEGASLYAVSKDNVFEYEEDIGWKTADSIEFRQVMMEQFTPISH